MKDFANNLLGTIANVQVDLRCPDCNALMEQISSEGDYLCNECGCYKTLNNNSNGQDTLEKSV